MGSLDVASCLPAMLQAVKTVQQQHAIALTIAGGGPLASSFRALAARPDLKDFLFLGRVPMDRLSRYLDAADVCLVYYDDKEVSRYRSSMKLRAYLAMGKKVACNDIGEMELFKDVTYQSTSCLDAFGDAICSALKAGDGRERKAPDFIRTHFSWEEIGRNFFEKLRKEFDL